MAGYLQDNLWIRKVPSQYTSSQLSQYLATIGLSIPDSLHADGVQPLQVLERVVRHHLLAFPFENTAIHYTPDHTIDVSPQGLFQRFVLERKGSYCFGQNTVLLEMLRAMGFRAYAGSARVNMNWQNPETPPLYTSQTHMVVFVQPFPEGNITYVVDVGFGGSGLGRPIPLISGEKSEVMGVGPTERHMLHRGPLSTSSLATSAEATVAGGHEMWFLRVQHTTHTPEGTAPEISPWKTLFAFTEHEFSPMDCSDASRLVSTSIGLFTDNVLAVRHIAEPGTEAGSSGNDSPLVRISLFGSEVKLRKTSGETETLATVNTEMDRVRVLREIFGLNVRDEDAQYIVGTKAEIVETR